MSRRIEVELTSTRPDGTWTWRAAGAKLPKGELDGSLLFAGAKVGDVVRADAEFLMDGIEILSVLAPKGARKEPERIEVIGTPRRDDEPMVTTRLAPKGRGGDRRGDRRGDRPDRRRAEGPAREGRGPRPPRGEGGSQDARRAEGDRRHHPRADRTDRPARPPRPTRPAPERPKAKRLRAGRTHRNAVLADLPAEQRPVAEQVLRGGIPAVRQAIEKQNAERAAAGQDPVPTDALLKMAEDLTPALRSAEWRDRAEAALADLDELDLRDLRSVVVAADLGARDEESRALAEQLRAGLARRVEAEQAAWLAEIAELLAGGRAVRALRVSSRPPKAGAPLPADLAARLSAAAASSLTAETAQDRYATVLEALAFSPVRTQVEPEGVPAEPTPELLAAVTKVASRLPAIAARFGIEAKAPAARQRPPKPPRPPRPASTPTPTSTPEGGSAEVAEPVSEASVVESGTAEVSETSEASDVIEPPAQTTVPEGETAPEGAVETSEAVAESDPAQDETDPDTN